jgi:hypothetical protein
MNGEERRKNETSTYIPSHGCSPFTCLQLSLAESRLYACSASLEIIKSMIAGDCK